MAWKMSLSPSITIGIDPARGPDLGAVFRAFKMPGGQLVMVPDYIPDAWLDRITPEWGPRPDGTMAWHFMWTGWNNGQGHGKVRRAGKTLYTHRDVVERVTGRKLARKDFVDHLCKRKPCLTFGCLEVVPPGENTRRGPGVHHQFKPAAAKPAPESSPDGK